MRAQRGLGPPRYGAAKQQSMHWLAADQDITYSIHNPAERATVSEQCFSRGNNSE